MKNTYDGLLEYYDELFPLDQKCTDFILSQAENYKNREQAAGPCPRPPRILEIGCAAGITALFLARQGMDLVGIDANEAMIRSANRRNHEPKSNARFFCMDMLSSPSYFPAGSFDMILCLEDNLAGLEDPGLIRSFLRQIHGLLADKGVFIFELINYDWVLDEYIEALPLITTVRASYIQKYLRRPGGRLCLNSSVLAANGYPVFSEEKPLYPIGSGELGDALDAAGFREKRFYSDFEESPLARGSMRLIGTART
ncbi:MAG: class I SAM-dependent methyltransferase [Treponema sp.]|jgi:SAM-dependent methyltransferase|nr:class I SAM-dependent methyltransferase [Treponema sp.]